MLMSFNVRFGLQQALIISTSFTLMVAFAYILNRLTDFDGDIISNSKEALKVSSKVILALALILATCLGLFWQFDNGILVFLFFLAISILYSLRIKNFQIRKVFFVKNVWAAGAWYASLYFSMYLTSDNFSGEIFIEKTWQIFAYMTGIEIFYDLKDLEGDKESKTQTLPVVLGPSTARLVALCFMFPHTYLILNFFPEVEKVIFLIIFVYIYITKIPKLSPHLPIYMLILFYLIRFFI